MQLNIILLQLLFNVKINKNICFEKSSIKLNNLRFTIYLKSTTKKYTPR